MFELSSIFTLDVALAVLLIFAGSFVQTTIGFGMAIVAAPLLFQLDPHYVPAPICLVAIGLSLINASKHKSSISIGGLKMAIIGRIPGSVVGGLLLVYVSASLMSLALGFFVLLSVCISLLPIRIEPNPSRMMIAGFFSGFMGTSSAIGGPPMALLLQHQEANKLRGNLSAFFFFSSIMSLIVLFFVGHFTLTHVWLTLPLLPASYLGYRLALLCLGRISQQSIRYGSLVLCSLSGITAIVQGFLFY
ncbi:sulfite exporter TauE/SafE family protein [Vibrio ulleungensis]|jgi:uncharacterized membrane protein YfcA|uniref:Probable membrane transporter protein n=1 Tax=Vibrio ulleungensis TaxID=2807619 RepID=A0ABS2HJ81_9VIBR|nr:sulfite exporter TauE/SafE family protein [Vibrio ulleungensis]MBM7035881.1 sulfite exporter TauE/SafE family protein [Vibrio ulleungensis]